MNKSESFILESPGSPRRTMAEGHWEMTHSVEANVDAEFAWNFWTNIANWADPPAQFELDGRFAAGTHGLTRIPGQEPLHWAIASVDAPRTATIVLELDGAEMSFCWKFETLDDERSRLTQHVALKGEKAGNYVRQAETNFTKSIPEGMNRLASAMEGADSLRKRSGA